MTWVRKLAAVVTLGVALAACGGDSTSAVMPEPVLADEEIRLLEARAESYAEEHVEVWPDVDAFVAAFAEDVTFSDPTFEDFRPGRGAVVAMLESWERATDYSLIVEEIFVDQDRVIYQERMPGLLPPVGVPDPPPAQTEALEVFTFVEDAVVGYELWYPREDHELFGFGCFAVDACPALGRVVETYVDGWSSRQAEAIESLYAPDAIFHDGLLGLDATGSARIADLADVRFGDGGELTFDVLRTYAWTDGYGPPTEAFPQRGRLIGVALHHRVDLVDGSTQSQQEAITTLLLGTRDETGITPDPEYRIHDEQVYHRPSTLRAGPVETETMQHRSRVPLT